jgi:hypothetical protein
MCVLHVEVQQYRVTSDYDKQKAKSETNNIKAEANSGNVLTSQSELCRAFLEDFTLLYRPCVSSWLMEKVSKPEGPAL